MLTAFFYAKEAFYSFVLKRGKIKEDHSLNFQKKNGTGQDDQSWSVFSCPLQSGFLVLKSKWVHACGENEPEFLRVRVTQGTQGFARDRDNFLESHPLEAFRIAVL